MGEEGFRTVEVLVGLFSMSLQWKGVEDGLFGHVQGFMAQMITM